MRRINPDQIVKIVTMRAAGYPLSVISREVGVSISTIQRACKRRGVKCGEAEAEMVESARQALIDDYGNNEELQRHRKKLIADIIAQGELGREKAFEALESLSPDDTSSAALTLRAITAHATAMKGYADSLRQVLPEIRHEEKFEAFEIHIMGPDDEAEIRRQQAEEDKLLGYGQDDDEDDQDDDDDSIVELA